MTPQLPALIQQMLDPSFYEHEVIAYNDRIGQGQTHTQACAAVVGHFQNLANDLGILMSNRNQINL